MKRWHEIDESYRADVIDDLDTSAAVLLTRDVVTDDMRQLAEAFQVAIAVLIAVAEKGERIANGEAIQLYGDLRVRRRGSDD